MNEMPPDLFPPLGAMLNEMAGGGHPVATSASLASYRHDGEAWPKCSLCGARHTPDEPHDPLIATCGCGHQQLLEPEDVRDNYIWWRCEECHRQNSEVTYKGASQRYLPHYTDAGIARTMIDREYHGPVIP